MELEKTERSEQLKDNRLRLRSFQKQINKTFDDRLDEYYIKYLSNNDLNIEQMNTIKEFCNYIKTNK